MAACLLGCGPSMRPLLPLPCRPLCALGSRWLYAPRPAPPSSWWVPGGRVAAGKGVLAAETTAQQERLQAIAEKRRWQAEMESKRRQLEDDRRQLQHLKSKALRERWLLGETSSASQGDEDMRRQMREDEQRARLLEGSISRLQKEIEVLENAGPLTTAAGEGAAAPSPAKDEKTEVALDSRQAPVGTPKAHIELVSACGSVEGGPPAGTGEKGVSNTPVRTVEGSTMMKAVVHAVDGTAENGIQPLSSSEVDELIHKADEVTLSEAGSAAGAAEARGAPKEAAHSTPSRREITGVQAQPGEATSGPPGIQPGQEPPVTMIFMGYQNVEDEAESQKVLGLQGTITAELVVIEDAAELKEPAPPNGSAAEPPAAAASREENQVGPEAPASDPQDLDTKKQRCKCCSIM
ncbi:paralemmin-1 isoform X4 [Herpailurus yagouaroundi]|uniref:paralemmin-1 isoform X4 n=1 Tax=Herpailurus yagouaroundi TaxID=1608482 RepID=UPI001AD6D019|nr:paralemmin-1 isoform X4 [Puma yagouaroundi]